MMNCAEYRELLVAYLEGLLEDSQKQAVEEHLRECETCRTRLQGLQTLQQRLVDSGSVLARTSVEDEVMNRIIREQNVRLKSAAQAGTGLAIRRLMMKRSMVKIAVAAAVVLAALGGAFLWTGTKSGVALADVLARVEQIQAFMYKATMHMTGSMQGMPAGGRDMEMSMLVANEYGMKMEMSSTDPNTGRSMSQQAYVLPQQKILLTLMPQTKQYMRMELDDSLFKQMRKKNNDPRILIRQILECKYEELGKSVIDGVEVQGFRTTDPAYMGGTAGGEDVTVWVDAKSWLPVRMDMKIKMNDRMEMEGTLHDFRWDVPVTAAQFNPIVPADYTAGPADGLKVPAMTEETALAGLKLCLDLTGKYPDSLNLVGLMQMMTEGFKDSQTPAAQELRQQLEPASSKDERLKETMGRMMSIQMLASFYATLVQEEKEPAYYGKVVQPGDIAQVLLRWKIAENQYRVIFGDLHAATVDADTLAQLEAGLPQ